MKLTTPLALDIAYVLDADPITEEREGYIKKNIYIYIEREREREQCAQRQQLLQQRKRVLQNLLGPHLHFN